MKGTKKKRARVSRGSAESAQGSGQNFERARAAKNLWKTGYHKDKRTGYVVRTSTSAPLITHQDEGVQQDDIDEYGKEKSDVVSRRSPQPSNYISKASLSGDVKCRVASFNVGTLRKRNAEVVETLTRRRVDICSLQEHRKKGSLERNQVCWVTGKDSRMRLYWCGNQRGLGGVGIMLAEKWVEKVFEVQRISDRILLLKLLLGKQVFTFVALYAPQVGRPMDEKDQFYDQLQSTVMGVPTSEVLFVLGDWNGHVGASAHGFESVHGGHGYGERNMEGERILDFALANDLIVGNTQFSKRESHLVTYSSGGKKTQVDYMLYRKNFRRSVTNVKVIPGEEVVQQHFLLVCDFNVRIPPQKKRKFVPRLRSWKLRDPAIISRYAEAFSTKVADAISCKEVHPVEAAWNKLKNPLLETASETCGYSKSHQWRQESWWWNEQVDAAIESKRALYRSYESLRKRGNTPELIKAHEDYLKAKRHAKHAVWLAKSAASEEAFKAVDPQGSNIYRIARQMKRENQDIIGENCVRNDANELALTDEGKKKAWVQHYRKLLNVEFPWPKEELPEVPPVAGTPPPVTSDQIRKSLSNMKYGKAAGPSGIIAEMMKASGEEGIELMRQLCEEVFRNGVIPSDWEESTILNLYKGKGDALDRGNYRGLKLTDQVMKLCEGVLEKSIRGMVDIDGMQFGFVPGRGTTDAIFIARQMQEKYRAAKKPLYFAFVDLEKAFDRVPREVLWWALRSVGVEEWAVRVIQGMYSNARSRVRVNGQCSEEFEVRVGVHQGSVLSPLLFILVLEALSREFRTGVPWELLYADDLIIMADSEEKLVERIRAWKKAMEDKGLRASMPKTKCMISGDGLDMLKDSGKYPCAVCRKGVGRNSICCTQCLFWVHKKCSQISGRLKLDPDYVCPRCRGLSRPIDGRPKTKIEVDGVELEVVGECCYLGDMMGAGGGCANAISNRCGIAWGKFRSLIPVLTSRHVPLLVRGRVFSTCVRTAMLHGSETWGPNSADLQRLRRNDRSMIRWICGVGPRDDTSTEDLLTKLGLVGIEKVLRSRRLRWYGHAVRSQECINSVMDMEVELDDGYRSAGRPRKTWRECVRHDITDCSMESVDPLDRVGWRRAVRSSELLPTPVSGN